MSPQRKVRHVHAGRTIIAAILFGLAIAVPFWLFQPGDKAAREAVFPRGDAVAGTVREVRCPFRHKQDPWLTCVRAYVPQDHDDPSSPVISILATVIEPQGGATRDDPFIYLEGGPGYSAIYEEWEDYGRGGSARSFFRMVLETGRALILVDTRGLGFAEPALNCPGYMDAEWETLKVPPAERSIEPELAALEACFGELAAAGVDVAQYHSRQLGRDLKVLREGLGIAQWNAYGISYGAQSLLALLDADRAGVRTAIFDSPSYGRLDFLPGDQAAFERAIGIVAEQCTLDQWGDAEEYCEGDIGERLAALLEKLDARPLTLRNQPFAAPVYLGGDDAVSLFHEALYHGGGWWDFVYELSAMEKAVPGYLSSLRQDNIDWYNSLWWNYQDTSFSYPVYLATTCTESDTETPSPRSPVLLISPEEAEAQRRGCYLAGASWDGGRFDAADYAGVPALVFSGWRDVITPPDYGEQLAADIGGSFILNMEESHGVVFWAWDECEAAMMTGFLDDPSGVDFSMCPDRCALADEPAAAGDDEHIVCREPDEAYD